MGLQERTGGVACNKRKRVYDDRLCEQLLFSDVLSKENGQRRVLLRIV